MYNFIGLLSFIKVLLFWKRTMKLFNYLKTINTIALITVTLGAYADQQPTFTTYAKSLSTYPSGSGHTTGYAVQINPATNTPIVVIAKDKSIKNNKLLTFHAKNLNKPSENKTFSRESDQEIGNAERVHFAIDKTTTTSSEINGYIAYINTSNNSAAPIIEKGSCADNGSVCKYSALQLPGGAFPAQVDNLDIATIANGDLYLTVRELKEKDVTLWKYSKALSTWTQIGGRNQDTSAKNIRNNSGNLKLRVSNENVYLTTTNKLFKIVDNNWLQIGNSHNQANDSFSPNNEDLIDVTACGNNNQYICIADVNSGDSKQLDFYKFGVSDETIGYSTNHMFTFSDDYDASKKEFFDKLNLVADGDTAYITLSGYYTYGRTAPLNITKEDTQSNLLKDAAQVNGVMLFKINPTMKSLPQAKLLGGQNSNVTTVLADPSKPSAHSIYIFGDEGDVHTVDNIR